MEPNHPNSADVQKRMQSMVSHLREHDFRITPQRLAVLRVLAASEGHPSVEQIYETVRQEFPTTSIATIYKTVNILKQINELLEISFPDGSNRYDGHKPFPHPHVICVRCKKILDLDPGALKEITAEAADQTGFDMLSHRLDFFGICGDCKKDQTTSVSTK